MNIILRLIIISSISYANCLNSSLFDKKEVLCKSIEVKCKDINSKYINIMKYVWNNLQEIILKFFYKKKINRFIKINN